ncbi:MAG: Mini-ribonuclease 3 [Bacilli bacterium]
MTKEINSLTLAYLGDSIYEIYIRLFLIKKGIRKVKELQKESINFVSAKNQAKFLSNILEQNILTQEEIDVVYRARNHKSHSSKSTDIITYKYATALEALIGYLYLENNIKKIEEIMNIILGEKICIYMEKM